MTILSLRLIPDIFKLSSNSRPPPKSPDTASELKFKHPEISNTFKFLHFDISLQTLPSTDF